MKQYKIEYSQQARTDLIKVFDRIFYTYHAPRTAEKYLVGLLKEIERLQFYPLSFAVITIPRSVLQHGEFVRRINYKSETILYTVFNDMVWIHRIAPAATLSGYK
ncbi:MAG: hypothetical protein LBU90_10265 [Bacteroidales bacterium]|jgi:plasmid stabilization system protein ParE|nr:hypothetical protein [Bacteroidales bacterium]